MPEKEFSSRNNGRDEDAAQNQKHLLKKMSPEELEDALADVWDVMDETNYNPEQIDVYLAELEEKEAISPSFNADVSLAAFHCMCYTNERRYTNERYTQTLGLVATKKIENLEILIEEKHWLCRRL